MFLERTRTAVAPGQEPGREAGLVNPRSALAEPGPRRPILTDSGDLPGHEPIASLGVGEIFGEMTCMNFYPRAATVRAQEDSTLIEILRNVLDHLKRAGPYKW